MGTLGPVLSATGQGRGARVVKTHQAQVETVFLA